MERIRGRAQSALRARPWLLPTSLAALVIVLTVLIPGYIATQPSFLDRFSNTQKYYSTWAGSTHAEISCQSCHIRPDVASQTVYDLRMAREFYLSALLPGRLPGLFEKPTNQACEACHYGTRTVSPSGDLKIPHRAHVQVLGLRCVFCHKYAVHFKNPEGNHAPRMATCLSCHDGKKAKNNCSACHERKSAPLNHRAKDWLVVHPRKQAELDCAKCHGWVKHWCRQCHLRRPASHKARWRTLHGAAVAAHRNCETCHKGPFCARCHGEVPALNRRSAPKYVE